MHPVFSGLLGGGRSPCGDFRDRLLCMGFKDALMLAKSIGFTFKRLNPPENTSIDKSRIQCQIYIGCLDNKKKAQLLAIPLKCLAFKHLSLYIQHTHI